MIHKTKYALVLSTFSLISIQAQNHTTQGAENLSFSEYLSQVNQNNLSLLAEKYNLQIAEAEVIAQKVLPDPELTVEAADENYTLALGYTLELGKRGARMRLAESQAELAKLALEMYFQELRAESAVRFAEAIHHKELLEVRQKSYESMLQLSHSDSIRFRAGEITQTDAYQSKLEAALLLNAVFEQEAAYKSALVVLNRQTGKTAEILPNPLGQWTLSEKKYTLPQLIEAGKQHRIDLLAAKQGVTIAVNQRQLLKAERRTDIGLSVSYEKSWKPSPWSFQGVKAGVSVPLKFSNSNKGALQATQFGIKQAEINEQAAEMQVQSEIAQAFFYFEAATKKLRQFQSGLLDNSKKVLEGTVYKYNRGETGIVEVLIAQRSYNDVQEQYLEAKQGYFSSLIELHKTCGTWDVAL